MDRVGPRPLGIAEMPVFSSNGAHVFPRGQPLNRAGWRTVRCPPLAAPEHPYLSQVLLPFYGVAIPRSAETEYVRQSQGKPLPVPGTAIRPCSSRTLKEEGCTQCPHWITCAVPGALLVTMQQERAAPRTKKSADYSTTTESRVVNRFESARLLPVQISEQSKSP